jgi:16S rRNA (uracil1498-N3)-methyltransferase
MSRRRFYAPPNAFDFAASRVALSLEESKHLRDVLRVHAGDEVFVFDGEGHEFACRVQDFKRRAARVNLSIIARVEALRPESSFDLTLAVALLKGERFDFVVQKATELGANKISPVITKRSDVKLRAGHDGAARVERWRRIAIEAAKQSGRARAPKICAPLELRELLRGEANASKEILRVMFAERAGRSFDETFNALNFQSGQISSAVALVGAEGGWDDEEIAAAKRESWRILTLGGRTLRAETAAIVAAALLQHRFGDLR